MLKLSIKYIGPYKLSPSSSTSSFYLSKLETSDIPQLYSLLRPENESSRDIHKWTSVIPYPYQLSNAEYFVRHCQNVYEKLGKCTTWAIRNDKMELIGCIGCDTLVDRPYLFMKEEGDNDENDDEEKVSDGMTALRLPKRNDYEIGYYVSSDYKNLGIATSAVDFITNEIIFKEFNCEKVYGIIFKDNIGSEKVLRKSGFEFVGEIEGGLEKNQEKKDLKCFLKIKKMQ